MVQDCSTPAAQLAPMIEDLSSPIGGIANSASTESPIPVVYSAHTLPHPPVDCATGTPLLASRQGAPAAKPAPRVVPTNRPLHLTEVKTEKAAKPSSKKHELSKGRAAPGSAKDTLDAMSRNQAGICEAITGFGATLAGIEEKKLHAEQGRTAANKLVEMKSVRFVPCLLLWYVHMSSTMQMQHQSRRAASHVCILLWCRRPLTPGRSGRTVFKTLTCWHNFARSLRRR